MISDFPVIGAFLGAIVGASFCIMTAFSPFSSGNPLIFMGLIAGVVLGAILGGGIFALIREIL